MIVDLRCCCIVYLVCFVICWFININNKKILLALKNDGIRKGYLIYRWLMKVFVAIGCHLVTKLEKETD